MDDNAQHPGSTRVEQKRGLYSLGLVSLGFLENSIFRRHLQDFGSSVKKKNPHFEENNSNFQNVC